MKGGKTNDDCSTNYADYMHNAHCTRAVAEGGEEQVMTPYIIALVALARTNKKRKEEQK